MLVMSWSEWPYWVKFGVVGFLIGSLSLSLILFRGFLPHNLFMLGELIGLGSWMPWSFILGYLLIHGLLLNGLRFVADHRPWLTPITYFVYGALIGWVYGKIKNRNNPKINNQRID